MNVHIFSFAMLNTSRGRSFEANVGNADIIKLYATLASPPASGGARGDGGASGLETVGLLDFRRLGAMSDEEIEAKLVEKGNRIYLDRLADMDLTASVSEDSVTLRWTKDSYVGQGVVRYRILRRAQGEQEFVHVADIPPRGDPDDIDTGDVQYEYVDSADLVPGTSYLYVVRAAVDRLDIDNVDSSVEVVTEGTPAPTATSAPTATATADP